MKLRVKRHLDFATRNLEGKTITRTYSYTVQIRHWFFFWKNIEFYVESCEIRLPTSDSDRIIAAEEVYVGLPTSCRRKFKTEEKAINVMRDIKNNPNKYIRF